MGLSLSRVPNQHVIQILSPPYQTDANIDLMEERKAVKVAFFKELYALDEPDDETEDTAGISEILRDSKKVPSPEIPQRRRRMLVSNLRGNAHMISNPVSAEKVPEPFPQAAILEQPPTNDQVLINDNAMHSSEVNIACTKNVATAARGKRKRGDGPEILPEAQQLFKGLAFCSSLYFPSRLWKKHTKPFHSLHSK